jgi:indole-3-glycerol phosphate synthase
MGDPELMKECTRASCKKGICSDSKEKQAAVNYYKKKQCIVSHKTKLFNHSDIFFDKIIDSKL